MASSQARNLTGLLSGIGNTIGSMGGPGNALIDNVRTLNAPKLDQNDPASMRAYADWAMRNGDQQTAQQYQLAAGKMEQEQGAQRAAVDAKGFQSSINKLEEARANAISNVNGDDAAIAQIDSQYDTAVNAVSGKMNDMAAKYGLDVTGTDMLQNVQDKRAVTDQLNKEIESEKNGTRRAQLKRLLTGVQSDMISPKDAIEATTTGSLGGSGRKVQRSVNYKDGSIQTVYTDGSTEITTSSGNTFEPGDDGYEDATTGARDSGVSYAGDVQDAIGLSGVDVDQLKSSVSDYEQGILDLESAEYALADVDSAISMISGPNQTVNTGAIAGRIQNLLGIGGADYGQILAMGTTAAIDALQGFKGATSDFEFSKAELSSFADVLKSEEVNLGTLEVVRRAIEREMEKSRSAVQRGYDGIYMNSGSENQARRITGRMGAVPSFVNTEGDESSSIDPREGGVSVSDDDTNSGAVSFDSAWED